MHRKDGSGVKAKLYTLHQRGCKEMKKFVLVLLNVLLMMVIEIPLVYPQGAPLPFRIGGTVTIDGVQITQATDDGIIIRVTKPDGTNYADVNGNKSMQSRGQVFNY